MHTVDNTPKKKIVKKLTIKMTCIKIRDCQIDFVIENNILTDNIINVQVTFINVPKTRKQYTLLH